MKDNNIKFGKELFVNQANNKIEDLYESLSLIGKGGNAKVQEVRNKKTNEIRACKCLSKLNINDSLLEKCLREIKILMKADHPNIIKLYEVFETQNSIYLIMEKCNGGELFKRIVDHISSGKMYTEKIAANLILKIMSAVCYYMACWSHFMYFIDW